MKKYTILGNELKKKFIIKIKNGDRKTAEYAFMDFEQGLIDQMLREKNDEFGRNGELEALDRMTLCLIKPGRLSDAAGEAAAYFERYKRDLFLEAAEKIKRRVKKVLARSISSPRKRLGSQFGTD
jgi:hypothetical protein